jgi:hypothetical protein
VKFGLLLLLLGVRSLEASCLSAWGYGQPLQTQVGWLVGWLVGFGWLVWIFLIGGGSNNLVKTSTVSG